jgi:cob(I)alamin adenosyltransferase
MSIVTGRGDDGSSALFGGARVPKHHPRLVAYGAVDEAQSAIGMVLAAGEISGELRDLLKRIQKELFVLGCDLATPEPEPGVPRITSPMIKALEGDIDRLESRLPALKNFVLPSGSPAAATCFWARAVVRRVERHVSALLETGQRVATVLIYLNRLGDLLFLVARALNQESGVKEETWSAKAKG